MLQGRPEKKSDKMKKEVHSIEEAILDYETITGDKIQYDPGDCFYMHVLPNFHFIIWAILEDEGERYLWLGECYGNMKEFWQYFDRVMEMNGLDIIITATPRDGRAHIRKWKMERLPEKDFISKSGIEYHVLKGIRKELQRSEHWA